MSKVLLTGAGGLIGSHIAEYLFNKGIETVCLIHSNKNIDFLNNLNFSIFKSDITVYSHLERNFPHDCDFLIHTAAKVSDWGKFKDFYSVNVIGTQNIINVACNNGIKDIIITGSISCYGEENSSIVKDEESGYHSHYKYFLDPIFPSAMNYYRDTKAEANRKAIAFAEEKGINLTILEPAWVYGEREFHSGFYDYVNTVRGGLNFMPGSSKNKFHTIYARDLAKIYYLAYQRKLKGIHRILAVDPSAYNQSELFDLFIKKADLKVPKRIPKQILYPPAFLLELIYAVLKKRKAPILSRARVNMFYDNIEYSDRKLRELLDYLPDFSLDKSVEKTVEWYKENNYL